MTYYILRGGDRNIYTEVPRAENHHRLVYSADAATALAWRNQANEAEFTWDEQEYTVVRNKRLTVETKTTITSKA